MATFKSLVISSGKVEQIPNADTLSVGSGVTTTVGNLDINAATSIMTVTAKINGNLTFDNAGSHTISTTSAAATVAGVGMTFLAATGGVASGSTAGGAGGTNVVQGGGGGAAAGGSGAGGAGGTLTVSGGSGGAGTATGVAGAGANISINGGNAGSNGGAGGANGGSVDLDGGSATGAGTNGSLTIGTNNASAMTFARSGINVTANGTWTFADVIVGAVSGAHNVVSTSNYTCPAATAVGDLVYISANDTVARANATSTATMPIVGFVYVKPTSTTCGIKQEGEIGGFSSLTAGTQYFVANSDGGITSTAPSGSGNVVQRVAIARNTTTLVIRINENYTVL